jgi:hypothetical protein
MRVFRARQADVLFFTEAQAAVKYRYERVELATGKPALSNNSQAACRLI